MSAQVLEELLCYPVKSMRGVARSAIEIVRRGPVGDRRWMIVDPQYRFVTGRQLPALARCRASEAADSLSLSMDAQRIDIARPDAKAKTVKVTVWRDTCEAHDAGDAAADWLTRQFGRDLRLVYQSDDQHRWLSSARAVRNGDEVSFADGYPLLLIGSASLADLNSRLAAPVSMAHFRPNLVVRTAHAFIEDEWSEITIGNVRFAAASRCSRCIFTTVDPARGERRDDGEPLRTLSGYRRDSHSGEIMFGVNLVPLDDGMLRVGDSLQAALHGAA